MSMVWGLCSLCYSKHDKRKGGTDHDYTITMARLFEVVSLDFWKRTKRFLLAA